MTGRTLHSTEHWQGRVEGRAGASVTTMTMLTMIMNKMITCNFESISNLNL